MNYFHPGCQVQQYPTLVNPCIWVLYDLLTHTSWLSPSPKTSLFKDAASFAGTRLSFTTIVSYVSYSHQLNHISTYDRWKNEVELFSTLQDGQSSAITAPSTSQASSSKQACKLSIPVICSFQSPTGPHPNPLANESQNAFSCLCKGRGAVH